MTNWRMPHSGSRLIDIEDQYGGFAPTCGANAAKTSWAQLVTSTPENYFGLVFQFHVPSWSGFQYSFDLGIGVSGSEKVLIEEVMTPLIAAAGLYSVGFNMLLPFFIPAGSNLHSRGRTSRTSNTQIWGGLTGIADNSFGRNVYAQSQWMNVNTTVPSANQIDCGATPNTWTAWADLTDGPLAIDAKYLMLFKGCNDTTRTTANWRTQLAIGGSGSEQVIADTQTYTHSSSDYMSAPYLYLPVQIPSGTTLRHRAMCNIGTATDRIINLAYYFFG